MLDDKSFQFLVRNAPLISIDLIVKNKKNQVLLGLRKNAPARNFWFVPGGRIFKNETFREAIQRIVKAEINLKHEPTDFEYFFFGVYEHNYADNYTGRKNYSTHYVVLAVILSYDFESKFSALSQHNEYKYFDISELLASDSVHHFTKQYFEEHPENKL